MYQHFYFQAEQSVTYHIKRIMNGYMPPLAADPDNLINAAEAEERIQLSATRERQFVLLSDQQDYDYNRRTWNR